MPEMPHVEIPSVVHLLDRHLEGAFAVLKAAISDGLHVVCFPPPMGRDLQGCLSRNSSRQAQRRLLQRVGEISSSASDSPWGCDLPYKMISGRWPIKFPSTEV